MFIMGSINISGIWNTWMRLKWGTACSFWQEVRAPFKKPVWKRPIISFIIIITALVVAVMIMTMIFIIGQLTALSDEWPLTGPSIDPHHQVGSAMVIEYQSWSSSPFGVEAKKSICWFVIRNDLYCRLREVLHSVYLCCIVKCYYTLRPLTPLYYTARQVGWGEGVSALVSIHCTQTRIRCNVVYFDKYTFTFQTCKEGEGLVYGGTVWFL